MIRTLARTIGVMVLLAASATGAFAQAQRLAVLQAQERRASGANDLATIRAGTRSSDTDTALLAIRALGRLERPALVPDIAAALRFELPELRAEAANAIAAAFGRPPSPGEMSAPGVGDPGARPPASLRASVASAFTALSGRLDVETVPDVRDAICESIGRLPYADADQIAQAERVLAAAAQEAMTGSVTDRLGVAKGLDALARMNEARRPLSNTALDALRDLMDVPAEGAPRVRRLALDALIAAKAVDQRAIERALADSDMQVRRLAMTALGRPDVDLPAPAVRAALAAGLADSAAMVRLEAVHAEAARETGAPAACEVALAAARDPDIHVALAAIDALAVCGAVDDAVPFLIRTIDDLSDVRSERGWHRTAHALVALAGADPDRARALIPQFTVSGAWPLRLYAVKAAAVLNDRETVQKMTGDVDDAVADEAARLLARLSGDGGPAAKPRAAPARPGAKPSPSVVTAADFKRLLGARARISVRGVGTFELALLTLEAPETVMRFARLAESGYYDGLTIDRILPNFVLQTRVPGLHASVEPDVDPVYAHDELSAWPHVRGSLALSSDGRQPGEAQLFLDLVDNPGFDYQYTVFAHTLNGFDVVDALLEGDVIDKIEILP